MTESTAKSFRLLPESWALLSKVAEADGISEAGALEILIRGRARMMGIIPSLVQMPQAEVDAFVTQVRQTHPAPKPEPKPKAAR